MSNQDNQPDAQDELPDELVIVLRKPVTIDKVTTEQIALREPEVREIDLFTKAVKTQGEVAAMSLFIATVSGVSKAVIDRIGARDFKKATTYLSDFLDQDDFPETGGRS